MKKFLVLALAALLTVGFVAIADAARPDGTGITGSPHDFTDNLVGEDGIAVTDTTAATYEADGDGVGWNKRAEICRVCHVPHDHGRSQKYWEAYNGLLWNHAVVSADYTMYTSATLDGAIDGDPSGTAKLCLGCHDGAVAVDTYDRYAGGNVYMSDIQSAFMVPNTGTAYDLTATHPLSIVYDVAADTPTGGTSGLNPTPPHYLNHHS
ncbi:MAG: hypothetical protein L0956_07995, partial [Candidatus Mariimomonas ferrooxydans]